MHNWVQYAFFVALMVFVLLDIATLIVVFEQMRRVEQQLRKFLLERGDDA